MQDKPAANTIPPIKLGPSKWRSFPPDGDGVGDGGVTGAGATVGDVGEGDGAGATVVDVLGGSVGGDWVGGASVVLLFVVGGSIGSGLIVISPGNGIGVGTSFTGTFGIVLNVVI